MMDLFQHRYYRVNTMFLSILGLWPYQSQRVRYARTTFFTILVMSQIIPQILAVIESWDDSDIVLQSIPPFVTDLACMTKVVNIMFNFDKMLELVERMKIDWASLVNQPEISRPLHDYAEIGRKFTMVYTVMMYVCLVLFMGQPSAPKILATLKLINGSRPGEFPFPVDYYGIDMETYYYYALVHSIICVTVIITVLIAADTMFMVHVQHTCGMFVVVCRQLQLMRERTKNSDMLHSRPKDDVTFQYMVDCIKKHKKAIELGELIETSYTWAFFSIVGLSVIIMSVTGYQTVVTMDENPKDAMRFAAFTLGEMFHLFFQSYFSQKLKDHSEQIREYVYQTEWHDTSICTQKLISLVIMRTDTPCQLTAGKILAMTMENFAMILKTSMSYFTILLSMR